jgi:peptidoglycan/xylan/chitin deacetylase (PgdA/CDA1 family)
MTDATVCLTFDFDAVSPWLHMDDGERNSPTNRSRGVFGAEVGTPRILEFLERRDLPSTWFVPGHTAESFPEAVAAVHEAGHEIGHHGWSHTPPGEFDTRAEELQDVVRGEEAISEITGEPPAGYRSPSWDYSEHTVDVLQELGFEWCSNGMSREYSPYFVRRDEAPVDDAYDAEPTDLVEVPVSWGRDDYPLLAFSAQRQRVAIEDAFAEWTESFDWMVEHVPGAVERGVSEELGGVYVLTLHPQVIGRGHRLSRLGEFVDHVAAAGDVEFAEVGEVARAFRDAVRG